MNSGVKAVVFLSKYGQKVRSNIVQHEGHVGSEKHARLATAVAHLDYDDVSPYRELTGRVTSITTNKELLQEEKWKNPTPQVAALGVRGCL